MTNVNSYVSLPEGLKTMKSSTWLLEHRQWWIVLDRIGLDIWPCLKHSQPPNVWCQSMVQAADLLMIWSNCHPRYPRLLVDHTFRRSGSRKNLLETCCMDKTRMTKGQFVYQNTSSLYQFIIASLIPKGSSCVKCKRTPYLYQWTSSSHPSFVPELCLEVF